MNRAIRKSRRVISILMIIAMILPMIPVLSVSASEGEIVVEQPTDNNAADEQPEDSGDLEDSEQSGAATGAEASSQEEAATATGQPEATTAADGEETPEATTEVDAPEEASTTTEVNSISGFVWKDVVGDGEYTQLNEDDPTMNEAPVVGHTIQLLTADDRLVVDETETDEEGNYRFEDIAPGEYTIQPKAGEGFVPSSIGLLGRNKILNEQEDLEFAGTVGKLVIDATSQIVNMDIAMRLLQLQPRLGYNINIGTVTASDAPFGTTLTGNTITFDSNANGNTYTLTGTSNTTGVAMRRIVVEAGVDTTIVLNGIVITQTNATTTHPASIHIRPGANVNLVLNAGSTNTFKTRSDAGCILDEGELTVSGTGKMDITALTKAGINTTDGKLTVLDGEFNIQAGTGIGGSPLKTTPQPGGNINIFGGKMEINTTGTGIGGGHSTAGGGGNSGNITIDHAQINISNGWTGIGGGYSSYTRGGSVDTINISNSDINMIGSASVYGQVGIGGGYGQFGGDGGNITITDSKIKMTKKVQGIGGGPGGAAQTSGLGGSSGRGGTILLRDSNVEVTDMHVYGIGIGGGAGGNFTPGGDGGNTQIIGGRIELQGGIGGGNGSGNGGSGGDITIDGDAVVKVSSTYTAIGGGSIVNDGGNGGNGGNIVIRSGKVTAIGMVGIGGGKLRNYGQSNGAGTITIYDGEIYAEGRSGPAIGVEVGSAGASGSKINIHGGKIVAKSAGGATTAIGASNGSTGYCNNTFTSGNIEARIGNGDIKVISSPNNGSLNGNQYLYCVAVTVKDVDGRTVPNQRVTIPNLITSGYTYEAETNAQGIAYCWVPYNSSGDTVFEADHPTLGYGSENLSVAANNNNGVTIILGMRTTLGTGATGLVFKQNATEQPETLKVKAENAVTSANKQIVGLEWFRVSAADTTVYTAATFSTGYSAATANDRGREGGLMQEQSGGNNSLRNYHMPIGDNGTYWVKMHYKDGNSIDRYQVKPITVNHIYTQAFGTYKGVNAVNITQEFYNEPIPDSVIKNKVGIAYDLDRTTALFSTVNGSTPVSASGGISGSFSLSAKSIGGVWIASPSSKMVNLTGINLGETVFTYGLSTTAITVSFEPQGGTPTPADAYYVSGDPYGTLPTLNRPGFDFLGWSQMPTGGVIQATDIVSGPNHKLYAQWINYSLTYNVNGGHANGPAVVTGLVSQTGYVLDTATIPTHVPVAGKDVVFIGWTAAPDTRYYEKDDTVPTTLTTINITGNETVYAVWGYDTNGSGTPDVTDSKYTLTYDDNGGNNNGPGVVNSLLATTGYVLDTATIPTHAPVGGVDVVFIGWTAVRDTHYYEKDDIAPLTLSTVNITGNETVYAVWGYDTNGSGSPDVTDSKYTLTHDDNGGNNDGPGVVSGLLAMTGYVLNSTIVPTHAAVGGKDVVFIGWTAIRDTHYYEKDETAPVILSIINVAGNETVYAVWGYDTNGSGSPDVTDSKYTLTYDENGGNNNGPGIVSGLLATTGYVLDSTTIPTHAPVGGNDVVFIGWTAAPDMHYYEKNDTAPVTLSTLNVAGDATVYAVWGYDTNGSGTPDVTDSKYMLTYDENGGNSDGPGVVNGLLATVGYILDTATNPTHMPVGGVDVVFVGWTTVRDTHYYEKDETAPVTVAAINLLTNETVYAVWGYDTNGSGTPDVTDSKYTLTYDDNGGNNDGPGVIQGLLATVGYVLDAVTIPSHAPVGGKDVVFIGWTTARDTHYYEKDDTAPAILSAINLFINETVYAVWGYDTNGSGTPDVTDSKYTLTYDDNGGNNNGPAAVNSLLATVGYLLDTVTIPTHLPVGGKDIVFIGWTTARDTHYYEKDDITPTTLTAININSNETVYAVWGYDTNGSGTPDVTDSKYTLTYDDNGGKGDGPGVVSGLLVMNGYVLNNTTLPTHAAVGGIDVVFIGWTAVRDAHYYEKDETAPVTLGALNIAGNETVYAVWGYDTNGSGTPDVTDSKYALTYDDNGGNGDGPGVVNGLLAKAGYVLDTATAPTHASVGGVNVVFIGWTTACDTHYYEKDETAPATVAAINLFTNETVYAVWGYDTNGSGTPDVTDSKYTLTYDDNGGNNDGPGVVSGLLAATGYVLNTTTIPTHGSVSGVDVVFIGWSAARDTHYYEKDETAPVTLSMLNIAGNETVYAVWGYDTNGSGTPDVTDSKYTLTYDDNGGNGNGPGVINGLLAMAGYVLDSMTVPTHASVGGKDVVFIGWTAVRDTHYYEKDETVPATLSTLNIVGNETVYAVWGYDTNGSGTPDVTDSKYTLTYDDNGGNNDGPGVVSGLLATTGYSLNSTVVPTHTAVGGVDVVFVGWSAVRDTHYYERHETAPTTLSTLNIAGNETVYAVWGYDTNGSGTPDVTDSKYILTYDDNGGNNDGPGVVSGLLAVTGYVLNNTTVPTHAAVGGKDIVFIGWSAVRDIHYYEKDETAPIILNTLDIAGNETVYAVWGYDTNGSGTPDVTDSKYTLTYDDNGGNSDGPGVVSGLLAVTGYVLNTTMVPTHASVSGKDVVFIGWTAARDAHYYEKDETAPATLSTLNIVGNETVYAVWGYDTNGSGTPDVTDSKYMLTYDDNGGNNDGPGIVSGLLLTTGYVLNSTTIPTHAPVGGVDVVFIGWSAVRDIHYYEKDETAPVSLNTINITGNETVYALWGYDTNGSGTPDVTDSKYTLTYDDNGGNGNGPGVINGLLAKAGYVLDMVTIPTHAPVGGKDVMFIGWTTVRDTHCYEKDDTVPSTVLAINLFTNETVYALWGYDTNGSGTPDVTDSKYTLTYDDNGGNNDGPGVISGLLATTGYILNNTTVPTHASVSGKDVVFIGWSAVRDTHYYEKDETAPMTLSMINVTGNETVYALWGYDTNGSGTPDVTDSKYTLTYDDNGGNGDGPGIVNGLLAVTGYILNTAAIPTHAPVGGVDVVFIGWSAVRDSYYYEKNDAAPATLSTINVSGNETVYAVWGYDTNGSGTPDVSDNKYTLTYDDNGGNGDGPGIINGLLAKAGYALDTATIPTHAPVGGVDVVFIGWSAARNTHYYEKDETAPVTISAINLFTNEMVYAVWGYDTNGSGTPDITDSKYTLTYDDNGGNGDGPGVVSGLLAVTGYALDMATIPTHAAVGGVDVVFVGWTAVRDIHCYDQTDTPPATLSSINITSNETVYAVWGYDTTGSGTPDVTDGRYTLTFHPNGGSPAPATQNLLANMPVAVPGTMTQTGHNFDGWYKEASFQNQWDFTTDRMPAANQDLYAKWNKDTYTIQVRHVDRSDSPVAAAVSQTAAYGEPFIALAAIVSGKVYAGWYMGSMAPAAATINAVTMTPHITAATAADDNSVITLVYDDAISGGSGGGGTIVEPKKYSITEKHMAGAKVLRTNTYLVAENNSYQGVLDSSLTKSHNYLGYQIDNQTVMGAAPTLPAINNVKADHIVVFEYAAKQCEIKVTYEYHANDGKITALKGSEQALVDGGSAFAPKIPAFKQKVQTGWTLDGKKQTGKAVIKSVTDQAVIVLIYQQDMDEDGVHDYTISEQCASTVSGKIIEKRNVYIAAGGSYYVTPKNIAHHKYIGYRIDGGKFQTAAVSHITVQSSKPAIVKVSADQTVELLYEHVQYMITIKAIDEGGKTISGGYTVKREYQQSFYASAPKVKDHTFVEWRLDGMRQSGSTLSIASVEKDMTAVAVFESDLQLEPNKTKNSKKQQDRNEEQKKENYEFIKKPNVQDVVAGQTVTYTFSGFGNKWSKSLEKYAVSDKPDKGLDFVSAILPAFKNSSGVRYDVIYFTNQSGKQVLASGLSAGLSHQIKAPMLASGEYITAITFEFGTVPAKFALGDTMQMTFKIWDNPPAGTLTNIGILTYKVNGKDKNFISGYQSGSVKIQGWFAPPQTGDNSGLAITCAAMGVSLGGIILLTGFKKRKKEKRIIK